MTELVALVKTDCRKCIARRISRGKCKLPLDNSRSFKDKAIVDLDIEDCPLNKNQSRCDYILFAKTSKGTNCVVPIEMKSGTADDMHAVTQLRGGMSALVSNNIINSETNFRLVPLIASKGLSRQLRDELKKQEHHIRLFGKSETVRHIKCGRNLFKKINQHIKPKKLPKRT